MSNATRVAAFVAVFAVLAGALPAAGPAQPGGSAPSAPDPIRPTGTRVSGPISGLVAWGPAGNPYWIEGTVNLTAGSTLFILPGVQVLFNATSPNYAVMNVRGNLQVLGSAADPVMLTTNATQPSPWRAVVGVESTGTLLARNATIQYGALGASGSTSFVLDRLHFMGSPEIILDGVRTVSITNSSFDMQAVQLENSQSVNISFNEIVRHPGSSGSDGIWIRGSPGAKVIGNTIRGGGSVCEAGIEVESPSALIAGNEVSRCNWGVEAGPWNEVVGNRLHDNGAGIGALGVEGVAIRGNYVSGGADGMTVDTAPYANVTRNTVVGNTIGIDLVNSSNTTLVANTFRGNGLGARVRQGGFHRVHHNWFLDNGEQASDSSAGTRWDNGYPSGGNRWSDYAGDDLLRGPNQDIPGADGIGDAPYVIDADSQDRYPLMGPLPPTIVAASLSGAASQDLTLLWSASPHEGILGGTVAYRMMQAIGDAFGPYVEIDSVPASGLSSYSYVCLGCGHVPGDTTPHFCKVQAVDAANNTADSNLAARYAKPLAAGMNLLTVPLRQSNDSLSTVLQTVWSSVVSVRTYDAANASDPWKAYVAAKGHGEITTLPFGSAFWANATVAGQYTVAGLLVDRPTVLLHPGWNLVAYASLANETVSASLAGLPVTRVEAFAAIPDPYKLRVAAADEVLVWGEAYWVCATAEGVWTQG